MHKILINLEYDGTDYHGWIKQDNVKTIQGSLQQAIKKIAKSNSFKIYGASKTDAGVHAIGQKAIIEIAFWPKLDRFIHAINKVLPSTIFISSYESVSDDFSLYNIKEKTYEYTISDNSWSLYNSRYSLLWNQKNLDVKILQTIFNTFVGEKNFALFSGLSEKEIKTQLVKTIRTINSIKVAKKNDLVIIEFKAKGFIRHQIRYIVQAGLMCYLEKVEIKTIKAMLENKGKKLPHKAVPQGLVLKSIEFV